ncbi:MAG TPA: Dyp-type peroxidase [Longimicrobium sp.]|nr:Dyp-type peroxidase [Longimicrobium sp.]
MSDIPVPPDPNDRPPAPGAGSEAGAALKAGIAVGKIVAADEQALRRAERRAQVAAARMRSPREDLESARFDGRTSQASLLVMPRIKPGEQNMGSLLALLQKVAKPEDADMEMNPVIPFANLRTVHFLRILVHQPSPSADAPIPVYDGKPQVHGPPIPPKLLFSTDYDGTLDAHIDELLREAGPGLDQVFSHCEGWPGLADPRAVHDFFLLNRVESNTFYTGTMKRSVDQIHREAVLRDRVEAFLDAEQKNGTLPAEPAAIRQRILEFIDGQPELAWTKVKPGGYPTRLLALLLRFWYVAALIVLGAIWLGVWKGAGPGMAWKVTLGIVAAVLIVGGAAVAYLAHLSRTDPVIVNPGVKAHTSELETTEDRIVQNEMSSVIYIKEPLWFRSIVLRSVLAFINFSAKYLSNQGNLAGIPSIHFARWVIVDGGRRLVFFSNFDGSWDNYLGDFIDKSSSGLTAVWSNCVGFPRTTGLTGGGATNEQQFKAYSRQSQIPTQVWYSAYRWLSVSNINNNTRIRLGLYDEMDEAATLEWLRRFSDGSESATTPTGVAGKPVTSPAIEHADVQGFIARSYPKLTEACYVPVYFADTSNPVAARAWIGGLAGRVTPASLSSKEVYAQGEARSVALTFQGVKALGLDDTTLGTFQLEFIQGMTDEHTQRALGDTGPGLEPSSWAWGGPNNPTVHAMLFLFAGTPQRLQALVDDETKHASAAGVTLGAPLDSIMLAGDKEHFGFHDGIAQPRIDGLKADADASSNEPRVPAGEVVLGYPNAYGHYPATPSVPVTDATRKLFKVAPPDPYNTTLGERLDLGRNGSYVVFRQYYQDVKAFWEYLDQQAGHDPERRKKLGAQMVGRWPNGAPMEEFPDAEPPEFDSKTANEFMYKDDLHGDRCPLGSHIRRTNPRDGMGPTPAESLLVADRHRLLRRGRAYGPPLAPSFDPADILASDGAGDRGLQFICFNTDIGRQFEFVQNTWVNSLKFDGLYADPDPVIAPHKPAADPATHPEEVSRFTVQRCPVRHRVDKIPRFVTIRGGAYLFMPGIKALQYLADPR